MPDQATVTYEKWKRLGQGLFGESENWKFVCPVCGDVSMLQDFLDADHERAEAYRRLGRECIGRSLGALSKDIPKGKYKGRGCDWTAYGLFRGPVMVDLGDGVVIGCFRFAKE